jgi:hypothetical protein
MYNDLTEEQVMTFKIFSNARNYLIIRAIEGVVYDWGADYSEKNIKEHLEKLKNNKDITKERFDILFTLPKHLLDVLGFGTWDDETEYKLMLIPLWLFTLMPKDYKFIGGCITEDEQPYNYTVDQLDNDNRFGCLAYGVYLNGKLPNGSVVKNYEDTNDRFINFRRDSECCEG